MEIFATFHLESAHRLPDLPPQHKCGRIHGHSFVVEIHVRGPVAVETGWVVDFADIEAAFRPLHEQLDHHYLNEVEGLRTPTSENLAIWIWDRMIPALPALCRVVVRETCTSGCAYEGE
jgi:6-pyruvoyltetrahydropterin/6-carboxytetrahydropterin synthase